MDPVPNSGEACGVYKDTGCFHFWKNGTSVQRGRSTEDGYGHGWKERERRGRRMLEIRVTHALPTWKGPFNFIRSVT
jgi:hypothetical protein